VFPLFDLSLSIPLDPEPDHARPWLRRPRSCGHGPPSTAPPSPGGSLSTATSSSRIRSSQASPHHRDRLLQPSTIVIHYVDSPPSLQHRLHRDLPEFPYTETDAAATQYDYGVDDPSLLPEQP
uniref:Uncharacterized protein n=1 Tax=Triticum urartu TaxID=4572 RepID=A0A8R7UF72_TRIUA